MSVEKMEGRELDMAVAERVFDKPPSYYDCPHFSKRGRILSFCSCPDLPRYSRNIAAAMLVLLKLEELEPTATIRLSNGDGDSCDVDILTDMFCKLNAVHISLDGGLELLPEAICRAAVIAVEAE